MGHGAKQTQEILPLHWLFSCFFIMSKESGFRLAELEKEHLTIVSLKKLKVNHLQKKPKVCVLFQKVYSNLLRNFVGRTQRTQNCDGIEV